MSGPTVLGLINDNLRDIKAEQKKVTTCMTDMKVKIENHDVRLGNIETDVKDLSTGQKKIKETIWNHANDKKVHYNQGYRETFPQKAWRKKGEIGLITAILTVITWLINNYMGG